MKDFQTIINKLQELSPYQLYRLWAYYPIIQQDRQGRSIS
jgi:hypothetical protein